MTVPANPNKYLNREKINHKGVEFFLIKLPSDKMPTGHQPSNAPTACSRCVVNFDPTSLQHLAAVSSEIPQQNGQTTTQQSHAIRRDRGLVTNLIPIYGVAALLAVALQPVTAPELESPWARGIRAGDRLMREGA
jgi:hypothetical protein